MLGAAKSSLTILTKSCMEKHGKKVIVRKALYEKYWEEKCSSQHHQQSNLLQIFRKINLNFEVIVKSTLYPDDIILRDSKALMG